MKKIYQRKEEGNDCTHQVVTLKLYMNNVYNMKICVCVGLEPPPDGSGWSQLELAAVILVPSCLVCIGVILGMCAVQNLRCTHIKAHKQDPEEPLDDHTLVSPDKCLKELIYDMSTSGSGSGESWLCTKKKNNNNNKKTPNVSYHMCFFIT